VKVYEQLHTVPGGPDTQLQSGVNRAIAAAVTVTKLVKRVVPHTHTDIVEPRIGKRFEHILLVTVKIVKLYAARLKC
jgi:hypothetical protein